MTLSRLLRELRGEPICAFKFGEHECGYAVTGERDGLPCCAFHQLPAPYGRRKRSVIQYRPWRFPMMRYHFMRTCRGFHWRPHIYPGVNGCTTRLLVWLWWSVELP